jgi:hypothetical protein
MGRRRYSDEPETIHHAVGSGIMDALGRGFLIATAGLVLGAVVGTSQLAALGLWTLGVAGATGVGLMIGSALVKNAGCNRPEPASGEARQAGEVIALAGVTPVVLDAEAGTPAERQGQFVLLLTRQREAEVGMAKMCDAPRR